MTVMKRQRMTRLLLLALTTVSVAAASASVTTGDVHDTVRTDITQTKDTVRHGGNVFKRLLDYFRNANKTDYNKKFDFSLLGGPHYSSDTGFGIGLVGLGLYRQNRHDTVSPPSNVAIFGDVTTKSSYTVGIRGIHIFPHDRGRVDYTLAVNTFRQNYWGIGYEMGNNDANKSLLKRWKIEAKVSFMWQIADNTYIGPTLTYDYVNASEVERPELLMGMDREVWNVGGGLTFVLDSRDILTRPTKGFYVSISQLFRPRFLSSGYAFTTTDFRLDAYRKLWRGAVFGADVRGLLNFGNPSWGMMAQIGNSFSMRGYYGGRYRDKHKLEGQVELRQHIRKRHGIALWGGVGTIFDKADDIRFGRLLPNWGFGYRWELKKDGNIRLDLGFGKKGMTGFVFNINEAF